MRRLIPTPVTLDCGCTITPERTPGRPVESGGVLVHCTGHGLRHSVEVDTVEVHVTYRARRLDPPDPEPVEANHPYTVDVHLHGAEPYPCIVPGCGQPRQAACHGT